MEQDVKFTELPQELRETIWEFLDDAEPECRLLVIDEEWGFHPSDEKEIRRRLEIEGPQMNGSDVYLTPFGWVVECREGVADDLLLPPSWTFEKVVTYLLANYSRAGLGVLLVDTHYVPWKDKKEV
jgi:hypothetical protein